MKKLIVRFIAFLLIVGGLTTSFLIVKPKRQVNADTPSLYYFDVDFSYQNYAQIILYMLDIDSTLVSDTCEGYVVAKTNVYSHGNVYSRQCQFLRYTQLDYDDYDAFIYNFQYNVQSPYTGYAIVLLTSNLQGESTNITRNFCCAYYPTFSTYYENGKQDGETIGYNNATHYWRDEYFAPHGDGYGQIFDLGEDQGYQTGYIDGQQSLDTMSWFETITSGVSDVMNINLLPSITIGTLIFIPFMFMVLGAILWIWRHR